MFSVQKKSIEPGGEISMEVRVRIASREYSARVLSSGNRLSVYDIRRHHGGWRSSTQLKRDRSLRRPEREEVTDVILKALQADHHALLEKYRL